MLPWKPTLSGATWNSAGRSSASDRGHLENRCGRAGPFSVWCAACIMRPRPNLRPSQTLQNASFVPVSPGWGPRLITSSSASRGATAVPTRAWGEPLRRILPKINSLLSKEAASSRAVATNTRPPKGLQEPPVIRKPTILPLSRTGWHRRRRLLPTSLSSTTDAMPTGSWDRRARKV